jgi:hypothetical protein
MELSCEILTALAELGRTASFAPTLADVEPFQEWSDKPESWHRRDGSCIRRELLARYLLLNAVLDQGPDSEGVRRLLSEVTNALYRREIRFLHEPAEFFEGLGFAIEQIDSVHDAVRCLRSEQWARANRSSAAKYNLLMDNARQVLGYAIFRWGAPLALPLILSSEKVDDARACALLGYLRGYRSCELMSIQLKDHRRYGLGKAIGDKAAHLYAKWLTHSFPILADPEDPGWGPFGFEIPFDSNAGRVLWRTGFLLEWASLEEYVQWEVVQPGRGKDGTDYLRVTNIRGKKSLQATGLENLWEAYSCLVVKHLCVAQRPKVVEIQRIPLALLLLGGTGTPGEIDDALMYVGTQYCFNHNEPLCSGCPIRQVCRGYQEDPSLIVQYRT